MQTYRKRLESLMLMWRGCRARNPRFRGIFKLAPAPRARLRPAECGIAQWGFNSGPAQYLRDANAMARDVVERAGFEVMDGFGLTLHARPGWFDDARHGVRLQIHEAEVTSDLSAQLFLTQLCHGPHSERMRLK